MVPLPQLNYKLGGYSMKKLEVLTSRMALDIQCGSVAAGEYVAAIKRGESVELA